MSEGPFGGPRPFAEQRCEPLLLIRISTSDNRWKHSNPESMNKLMDAISESSGYLERNIYLRESAGPAEAHDFYGVVVPGTAEFLHSVHRSVERMEDEVESMEGVETFDVVLGAGDPEEEITPGV